MDLKQLQAFYWTAELSSMTAAATKLHTTQPAISQRIKRLENDLDVLLFQRIKQKLVLTKHGRELIAYASQVTNLLDEIHLNVGNSKSRVRTLRIGATDMVAQLWLTDFASRLADSYEEMTLEISVGLTVNLRQLLLNGDLDLAILAGPIPDSAYRTIPLGTIGMEWVVSPILFSSAKKITTNDLAKLPILSHTRGSDLYCLMEEWFAADNTEPPRFHRVNSLVTMIEMATKGLGATTIPTALVQRQIDESLLQVISTNKKFPSLSFFLAFPIHLYRPLADTITDIAVAQSKTYFQK